MYDSSGIPTAPIGMHTAMSTAIDDVRQATRYDSNVLLVASLASALAAVAGALVVERSALATSASELAAATSVPAAAEKGRVLPAAPAAKVSGRRRGQRAATAQAAEFQIFRGTLLVNRGYCK